MKEQARCRGCGMNLDGDAYMYGGRAYHAVTKKRVPDNLYGGFVCSKSCDYEASLEIERSMPGHGLQQKCVSIDTERHIEKTWNQKDYK